MSIQNPRTFLELCQRAAIECGVASNSAIQTVLPTLAGATGSLGRVVNWVSDSWSDLQMAHDDWDWMRSSNLLGAGISFTTIAGQASYPLGTGAGTVGVLPDDFGKWVTEDTGTFRNYTTAAGFQNEMFMDVISYDRWRNSYMLGAMRATQTRPVAIAVGPDKSLCLGPPPNATLTVTGDYFVAPNTMEVDADTPVGLPGRFTMLIVYKMMQKYAGYEAAPEVMSRGQQEEAGMYAQLQARYAPRIGVAGSLA